MISKFALCVVDVRENDASYRYRGRPAVASPTVAARLIHPPTLQIVRQVFEIFWKWREMSGLNASSKDES